MRIRTPEEFLDKLDHDLAWRRKELSFIITEIQKVSEKSDYETHLLRIGMTFLYAHWEGFVKESAKLYVTYVEARRLNYCELSTEMLALACKSRINRAPN